MPLVVKPPLTSRSAANVTRPVVEIISIPEAVFFTVAISAAVKSPPPAPMLNSTSLVSISFTSPVVSIVLAPERTRSPAVMVRALSDASMALVPLVNVPPRVPALETIEMPSPAAVVNISFCKEKSWSVIICRPENLAPVTVSALAASWITNALLEAKLAISIAFPAAPIAEPVATLRSIAPAVRFALVSSLLSVTSPEEVMAIFSPVTSRVSERICTWPSFKAPIELIFTFASESTPVLPAEIFTSEEAVMSILVVLSREPTSPRASIVTVLAVISTVPSAPDVISPSVASALEIVAENAASATPSLTVKLALKPKEPPKISKAFLDVTFSPETVTAPELLLVAPSLSAPNTNLVAPDLKANISVAVKSNPPVAVPKLISRVEVTARTEIMPPATISLIALDIPT